MKTNKPKIDLKSFIRAYEFGGITSYHVNYFDPVEFKEVTSLRTFSEIAAIKEVKRLKKAGRMTYIRSHIVRFDNIFLEEKVKGT